jgi:hypothetical protein
VNFAAVLRWLLANWRVAGVAAVLAAVAYGPYHYRDVKAREEIAALKNEYSAKATKQAVASLNVAKSQERTNDDLSKQHAADLARVRAYYRVRQQRAAVPAVPAVPERAGSPDAAPAERVAAGSCDPDYVGQLELNATLDALTIIEWQEWYEQQRKNHAATH